MEVLVLENNKTSRLKRNYVQTCNIRRSLVGNKLADQSDAVKASPVGGASTTSSFST